MSQASILKPCVFLDRDGVLNKAIVRAGKPYPPQSMRELEILPGVAEACAALKAHGFMLVVATNQPDVARGTTPLSLVEAMNSHLQKTLRLDAVMVCAHDSGDNCACRKPKPGMLLQAADTFGLDLAKSYIVGDRWRDVEAGQKAGCQTLFIDYGYDEKQPETCTHRVTSLKEAADIILNTHKLYQA